MVEEIQNRQRGMFISQKLNPEVEVAVKELGVFDPRSAIEKLGKYGIFTYDQLVKYLDVFETRGVELEDGVIIPIYGAGDDVEYFDIYEGYLRDEVLNPDQLQRFCKPLTNNHEEVIALLTGKPMTLSEIQYYLRTLQSMDGVRGRVSELVDRGIVERYYLSVKSIATGEVRSYTYHYLVGMRDLSYKWVESKFDGNDKVARVLLGEEYRERILKAVSKRPVFVVELAEIFEISEFRLLYMLRELVSSGDIKLFYQSILKDGKNGKFIAYLPSRENEVKALYKELRHFFIETRDAQDFVEKHKDDYMDYDTIVSELGISDSLCIAYLTNLRKREIIEQEGSDIIFSAFKFIWKAVGEA